MAAVMAVSAAGCSVTKESGSQTETKLKKRRRSDKDSGAKEEESTWPQGETLTIIVPFKAGGSADLMVRGILPYWEETAGCTFVVENREGIHDGRFRILPDLAGGRHQHLLRNADISEAATRYCRGDL